MNNAKIPPAFWRRTPPALFPSCLGALGLGLMWRNLAELGAPAWIGEALGLGAGAVFMFVYGCYLAKLAVRPSVIYDDLMVAPARGAVSGGSICLMLLSAILMPYHFGLAQMIWILSVAIHLAYMICVIQVLQKIPNPRASITPVILLPFVGFIVAGIAGIPLGFKTLSLVFAALGLPLFLLIAGISIQNALRDGVPAPNKTTFAIILAPVSVYALIGELVGVGQGWLFAACLIVGGCLAALVPWMARGGYNPGWGAFTFPTAAFGSVMIKGVVAGYGLIAWVPMIIVVVMASGLIPFVLYRTLMLWRAGVLAEATKAAVA